MEVPSRLKKLAAGIMAAATLESGDVRAEEPPQKTETQEVVKAQPEAEKNVDLKRSAEQAREMMREPVVREIAAEGVNKVNLDHVMLAFGDRPVIGEKSLIDLGAGPQKEKGSSQPEFAREQEGHTGTMSYTFLRTEIPLDRKLKVKGGKDMTVKDWIKIDAKNLGRGVDNDYEWTLLLVVELKKRGIELPVKDRKGKVLTLEDLARFNQEELDYKYNPDKLTTQEKKRFELLDKGGTCASTHALHALEAHAVFAGDTEKTSELTKFTFKRIQRMLEIPFDATDIDYAEARLHAVSHLITVLTELPPDHVFEPSQKELLKKAVVTMQEDIALYKKLHDALPEDQKRNSKLSLGTLSHAVDALDHLPQSFLDDAQPVAGSTE